MQKLSLNGTYQVYALGANGEEFSMPATVPCNVEDALMAAGKLPDIYFGQNVEKAKDFEKYDWKFERTFSLPDGFPKNADLVFAGVDTYAEYYLNGVKIGESDNAFITHRFAVDNLLQRGENTLTVVIRSALKRAFAVQADAYCVNGFVEGAPEGLRVRKAASAYGWDIMPRCASAGIVSDVWLEERKIARIEDVYFATLYVIEGEACLQFTYFLDFPFEDYGKYRLQISFACGESQYGFTFPADYKFRTHYLTLKNPLLWWHRRMGTPNLYDVCVRLCDGDRVVDERKLRFGVRHVRLQMQPFCGDRECFQFVLNNQPVKLLGFNIVPPDILSSHNVEKWKTLAYRLAEAGADVARIWGGGTYPTQEFYDICDEQGVFVWQDFMFCCITYPQDESFQKQAAAEVEFIAKSFRNHPSLLLYCGGNEMDWSYYCIGLNPNENILTRKTLPDALRSHDPHRAYLPTTPYLTQEYYEKHGGSFLIDLKMIEENRVELPLEHYWWHRDDFRAFGNIPHNFVAEIGFSGCPHRRSIEKFASKVAPLSKENPALKGHIFSTEGDCLFGARYAFDDEITDVDELIFATQAYQAEAYKYLMEITRIRSHITGVIAWTFNESYPSFNSGILDFYNEEKLAFSVVKRSLQPLQILMEERENEVVGYIDNSTVNARDFSFSIEDENGIELAFGRGRVEMNSCLEVFRTPKTGGYFISKLNGDIINGIFFKNCRSLSKYKKYLRKH